MGIFKERSDYLKQLAINNKLVAHTQVVDGEARNSFFRFNDNEEFFSGLVNYAHFPAVIHFGFSGRYTTDKGAVPKRVLNNALVFLMKADAPDMDSVENAYDLAFDVMEQFIIRMYYEFSTQGSCSPFSDLDPSRFSFDAYEENGNLFGWALNFNDEVYADSITIYDPLKWYE